jgi:hypothetical protein
MSTILQRFDGSRSSLIILLILLGGSQISSSEDVPLKVFKQLTLSSKEITGVLKGNIITKRLTTSNNKDIAVLGAMVLTVPAYATVEAARDIKTFKQGKEILGVEKFHDFDSTEMKTFTMQDDEIEDLGRCRIKDCETKLPGNWIQQLSAERENSKRMELLRVLLAEYAKDYASRGNKAVLPYENGRKAVSTQKEFMSILEQSSYLRMLAPDFYEYLKEYPEKELAGTENFIYWSREKFGFKPVMNLTHVSIYKWSQAEWNGYIIASRQVFADHYYEASLGLTILIDRPSQEGSSPGSYLIYINRSRLDVLDGFLSSLRRAITLSRIRKGLESHMKNMRSRVEARKGTGQPSN